ncbi:MAG: SDR family NAD(P)-dependent oxidoreductase [Candidatus Brachytrichaceae bacterium NZ_4S206]|jgi:NAD(P)-dependent dehydrogenase (short-subunit alcohol dehydrogenase family)
MDMLTNKRIIVTGATMGIGQAVAMRAAREGADVAFCGLTEQGADETIRAIESAGRRAFFKVVDLRDLDAARQFAREAIAFLGGLDGLVNNAGANTWHGVLTSTFEDLDNCFRVNFYHAWALSQEAYPHLKAAGGGVIVNLSSINAERTLPGVFPYNVAKAMLVALTKSIALEWGKDNIRSVAIQPGMIMTNLAIEYFNKFPDPQAARYRSEGVYPLKRGGRPEEIAATIVHILSGENGFLNGVPILIDGGISALYETRLDE